jgi:hypothetical protein
MIPMPKAVGTGLTRSSNLSEFNEVKDSNETVGEHQRWSKALKDEGIDSDAEG